MTSPQPMHDKPPARRDLVTSAAIQALLLGAFALAHPAPVLAQDLPVGFGATPDLPPAKPQFLPTLKVYATAPWKGDAKPQPASGLSVNAFARGLDHPRWLFALPNGDVLVAESNKPAGTSSPGFFNLVMGWVQSLVGAGVKSADRITLLRDQDGDGIAETRSVLLSGLHSPFGMALVGKHLYIANTDAVVRVPYEAGTTTINTQPEKVTDLPAGEINHHWTKGLIASLDGSKLYATVGSNSNIADNGIEAEAGRAAIWEIDVATGAKRLFATGLRNPNGLAWEPVTGKLWTTVNERDLLGDDVVPDYMTSVQRGGHYGWPYSYFGQNVDTRVKPVDKALVAKAIVPDFALGGHTASLGLAWSAKGNALPSSFQNGMVIGQHGSWNRNTPSGYKVVFVPFGADGKPLEQIVDVLGGFINDNRASGRPVGVTFDRRGALLVADDVGNVVWRVTGP